MSAVILPLLGLMCAANLGAQPAGSASALKIDSPRTPALRSPVAVYAQPDLIVTNVALGPGAIHELVSYCVKNIGLAPSKSGQVTIGFGGQWRAPQPAGLNVGPPYAFERSSATSVIAPGAQECKSVDSTIRFDQKYRDSCIDVTVIADATNTNRESNEGNNTAKFSSCNQPPIVFPRGAASSLMIKK
ncbi:MAG: CARDB domain-containing protein [Casimicrobium sp.]